ncbi:XRE family transcriptional regulator [bacterium]|nr:XRE family transcriptional regulator [bacterium]
MKDETQYIADKIRGVAAEKRASQDAIAKTLKMSRQAVNARMTGRVAFTAPEVLVISRMLDVPVSRFFPEKVGV